MKQNESVYLDYLFQRRNNDDSKYARVMKDDIIRCMWLDPSLVNDAKNSAAVLIGWNRVLYCGTMCGF